MEHLSPETRQSAQSLEDEDSSFTFTQCDPSGSSMAGPPVPRTGVPFYCPKHGHFEIARVSEIFMKRHRGFRRPDLKPGESWLSPFDDNVYPSFCVYHGGTNSATHTTETCRALAALCSAGGLNPRWMSIPAPGETWLLGL